MELLWIELKRQLPNTATVVLLHIQVRNWMHSASLFFYFLCGPLTDSLFSPNLSSLYFPAGNSIHPPCIPPSFPTSPVSFAWEDRLMWAILPNRIYMSATWRNWFSTPIASLFLHNLPLPYGSHSFFMLPPSLQKISSRKQGRGEIARATIWHVWLWACVRERAHVRSVCWRDEGGLAVSRTHRGRVRTLLFMSHLLLAVELFWYRGLSPALPWGPINSSQQLTQQPEHAVKLICLNVSLSIWNFSHCW